MPPALTGLSGMASMSGPSPASPSSGIVTDAAELLTTDAGEGLVYTP